jgi:TolA-binding protein
MVDLYPQHLLTGFILMRQAQILAEKGDKHQASDIFETVIENFSKEKDLVKQAETLKKAMLL